MGKYEEERLLNVVDALRSILDALNNENEAEEPGTTIFTFGEDWTLIFATGGRASLIKQLMNEGLGIR